MGGMSAAAILSLLGKRVLVLEQHVIPGGFTHMFKRPGYRWDVGVHIIGEMSERSFLGRLLSTLTGGRLDWEPVGDIYDEFHFPDGFTIQFPSSYHAFRETLLDYFPEEADGIDGYFRATRAAARAGGQLLQSRALPPLVPPGRKRASEAAAPHLEATTAEVLDELIDDPRLKAVLTAQWGYYGDPPSRSSFLMHALVVQHFMNGAYYPVGGASSIAEGMLQVVADAGGWTAVRRSVDEIVVRNGRAVGVRLDDGTEISAKRVVSAAGAALTSRLLDAGLPEVSAVSFREMGPAHVSLYLGFKGDLATRGGERYCQWWYRTWDHDEAQWDVHPNHRAEPAPVLFCSFPSLKDPNHDAGPDQRHTGEAITFVPWSSFEPWSATTRRTRPEEYSTFKEHLQEVLLEQYLGHYPDLRDIIDHVEMSSPISTSYYAASHEGSIYGLATPPARFADLSLLPKTSVKGLFLGGVDVATPGVAGALNGGMMAALAAEPLRATRFVQSVMRG
jgi:all-trans-retinol 13,14-reductase